MATSYIDQNYLNGLNELKKQQQSIINEQKKLKEQTLISDAEQKKSAIFSKIPTLKTDFYKNTKNAYVQKRKAQNELPQIMAAKGYTGGLTESSQIALENQYQNAYTAYKTQYEQSLRELQAQIESINNSLSALLLQNESEYSIKAYESDADYDKLLLDAKAKLLAQQLSASQKEGSQSSKTTGKTQNSTVKADETSILDEIYAELLRYFPLNTMAASDNTVKNSMVSSFLSEKIRKGQLTTSQANAVRNKFLKS